MTLTVPVDFPREDLRDIQTTALVAQAILG